MVILLLLWRAEGYHQSAVGHLSPFIHECRTYYLNSRPTIGMLTDNHGQLSWKPTIELGTKGPVYAGYISLISEKDHVFRRKSSAS